MIDAALLLNCTKGSMDKFNGTTNDTTCFSQSNAGEKQRFQSKIHPKQHYTTAFHANN